MPLILPKPGIFTHEAKRSVFHGYCEQVTSEHDAKAVIDKIRGKYQTANHNVFAYSIKESNTIRFNDDGEPSGTAGMPVLNVFQKKGIIDFVCVVTRFFGGTMLGAGGLVRAYTNTAAGAMLNAEPCERIYYTVYDVICAYSQFDKMKYLFNKENIEILELEFTDTIKASVRVQDDKSAPFFEAGFYTIV